MNPTQILMNQLQTHLKSQNPKLYQQFEQMKGNNPQEMLSQITSKYTPEQKQQFMQYANSFGISTEQLNKYGINS